MWPCHTTVKYVQLPPKPTVFVRWVVISWNRCQSSFDIGSESLLLGELRRRRAVGGRREWRAGASCYPTALTTLEDRKWFYTALIVKGSQTINVCTSVLISSGIVFCWIQEWTSASSSLCSWVNQGWRGWSTRSFSLSSANTSFWSLDRRQRTSQKKKTDKSP